jgi:hypothetical protein
MFQGPGIGPETLIGNHSMISGPVLPALFSIFRYESGNSWPLAVFFLVGGIGFAVAWLCWLHLQGLSGASLLIFALLPHPIYYMICVSTELPFSIFLSLFLYYYFGGGLGRGRMYGWIAMLILLLCTRPNGLAVLAFVTLDSVRHLRWGTGRNLLIAILGLLLLWAGFGNLFFHYFTTVYMQSLPVTFFGIPSENYFHGLFPALPIALNCGLSWLALLGAKLLYFFGLRPSYSNVWTGYVLVRALPGTLLAVGFFFLLAKGDPRHKLFVILFMLPILLVCSQDRYGVPIQPVLFYYFAKAFDQCVVLRPKRSSGRFEFA